MKFPRPDREEAAERLAPMRPLLDKLAQEKVSEARSMAFRLERGKLLKRFQAAFAEGKRVPTFVLAEALIWQGVPPAFWHEPDIAALTLEQRFDLFLFDVRWLRWTYPEHAHVIRYKRSRQLLSINEKEHHREAEWAFYDGKRQAWQHVQTLSLTDRQQWDCVWLRSAPIIKRHRVNQAEGQKIIQALRDDLQAVPRTSTFTEQHAEATVIRRHALWLCDRTTGGGPTAIAARYEQMTGQPITRQAASKQLEKLRELLKRKRS